MRHLVQVIVAKAWELIQASKTNYGVDPIIFVIISTIASPAFYYGLYRLVRAVVKRLPREIMLWGPIFGCAFIAPYVYVLFFGRNLPWWVYVVMALLVGQGVYSVVSRIRSKRGAKPGASGTPPANGASPPGRIGPG